MKYTGIIVCFIDNRRYGFIQCNIDGRDASIYFHISNFIEGVPALGHAVEFELGPAVRLGKPPQAINIRVMALSVDTVRPTLVVLSTQEVQADEF